MTQSNQPPSNVDPLADNVVELLSRLQRVAPDHKLLEMWGQVLEPHARRHDPVNDRLHGVVGFFIMKETDRELHDLQGQLEQILQPRLSAGNQ